MLTNNYTIMPLLLVAALFVGAVKAGYNPSGPSQQGCSDAGVSCCYSPTWWQDSLGNPSVTCTDGSFTRGTPAAADVLNDCQAETISSCNQNFCTYIYPPTCAWVEESGDQVTGRYAAGPGTCENETWQGRFHPGTTYQVYNTGNLKGGNNEVVWGDVAPGPGEPAEVENCIGTEPTQLSITGTYSHTSGWNIGGQLGLKPPSALLSSAIQALSPEIKLTGGYSDTISTGTNAGETVPIYPGFHGAITKGSLIHHSYGHWIVKSGTVPGGSAMNGCNTIQINNVGIDIPSDPSNPYQPSGWGSEVVPCGYPILTGKLE